MHPVDLRPWKALREAFTFNAAIRSVSSHNCLESNPARAPAGRILGETLHQTHQTNGPCLIWGFAAKMRKDVVFLNLLHRTAKSFQLSQLAL